MEQHAFARDAIEVRRLHPFGAVCAGVTVAPVVGDDEEDIGAFGLGLQGKGGEAELS